MAENIILKARVGKIFFSPIITDESKLSAAVWAEMPVTLRNDEISIIEEEPSENETFSHENDSPEDVDFTGKGLILKGSFIKVSRAQMQELLGGVVKTNNFYRSAKKVKLNKAIKFELKNGGVIIIPNASGYVLLHANLGNDGVLKFPFKFKCLVASNSWDCDIII